MPRTVRSPESAVINPAARRMSVVFPAPSGPTSAVSAPRRTSQGNAVERDRVFALIAMKRLMNLIADERRCELAGCTHCCTLATAPIPENGRWRVSIRWQSKR